MMGTSCCPPMKIPPVSDSATEETKFCRVLQMTWMAPLIRGRPAVMLLRYKILATRMRAWGRKRVGADGIKEEMFCKVVGSIFFTWFPY